MFDESLSTPATSAAALKEIKEKVDKLYELKLDVDRAEKKHKEAKSELAKILEDSGVEKVQGDLCTVNLALKSSCSVPKDASQKKELFDYISKNHGETVLQDMLTINARSFSSWHDKEIERLIESTGDVEAKLPMLDPYTYYSLGMRKRSVKK